MTRAPHPSAQPAAAGGRPSAVRPATGRSHRPWPLSLLLFAAAVALACADPTATTVRVARAVLSPDTLTIPAGRTATLDFTLTDSAGAPVAPRSVVWSSSNLAVATVSSTGVVAALTPGEVRIAASAFGRSATARVTVAPREVAAIEVTPPSVSLVTGGSAQLQARLVDIQGTTLTDRQVAWSSSNEAVATVTQAGRVTGVAPGGATITAAAGGRTGQVAVTVAVAPVALVTVSPSLDTLVAGAESQLVATLRDATGAVLAGRAVGWSSSNLAVATVSSTGTVRAIAPGTATVSATSERRVGSSVVVVLARRPGAVTLTPSSSTVIVGESVQLRAQVTDSLGNLLSDRPVTWTSENGAVASVNAAGLVTGVAPGTTRIAASSEGRTAFATVQVIPIPVATVQVAPATATLLVGATQAFTATARSAAGDLLSGRTVTWTSGAPTVLGVNASGVVTALAPGSGLVLAAVDGVLGQAAVTVRLPAVTAVTVTPSNPELPVNGSVQLTATLRDETGGAPTGRVVAWTSDDDRIAFVTGTGLVIGLRPGTTRITATSEGISGSTVVTVR